MGFCVGVLCGNGDGDGDGDGRWENGRMGLGVIVRECNGVDSAYVQYSMYSMYICCRCTP